MKFNNLILLIESRYSNAAKKIIQSSTFTPGQEMVRFHFDPELHMSDDEGILVDYENAMDGEIVKAPSGLVFTEIPYFFHELGNNEIVYTFHPEVLEFFKLKDHPDVDKDLLHKSWDKLYEQLQLFFDKFYNDN
jgi:hypothetical protein